MDNKEEKNDLYFISNEFDNDIDLNPNFLYLFKNFLTKENYQKNSFLKEIMPEYINIDSQIHKKINQVRYFYDITPLFREMQSSNTFAINFFKKGFRRMFFGPKGIVTRKSTELKNYYKSFISDIDLNSKIYAGSLDYYDYLSGYNSFFERLKESRKKILKVSGNFAVANNSLDKLHAAYLEYIKKRRKNSFSLNKNKLTEINEYDDINKKKDIKSKTENNFFNKTFTKNKNKRRILILDKSKDLDGIRINKKNSILVNFKKINHNLKKKEMDIMSEKTYKLSNKNLKRNSISKKTSEKDININNIQNNEFYHTIRLDKKFLSNKTTLNNEIKNDKLSNISKSLFSPFDSTKLFKKRKNTFIHNKTVNLYYNNNKSKKNLNYSNSFFKNKKKKNKFPKNSKDFNKSLKFNKNFEWDSFNKTNIDSNNINNINTIINNDNKIKKQTESIKELKLSLKKKINLTEPSNKKVENSLNKFIFITTRDYDIKKKNLFKKKLEKELIDLKDVSKSIENFNEMAKKVDFSDFRPFSPSDNQVIKIKQKPTSYNLAFSYKTRYLKSEPIKEFIRSLDKLKENKKEKRSVKNIRANVKKNFRVIHNLTINLDHIKKKFNY